LPAARVYDRDGTLVDMRDAVTVHIEPGGFQVSGPLGKLRRRIRRTKRGYDFDALARLARSLHRKHPAANQMLLVPGAGVEYQDVVHTLDATREGLFDVVAITGAVE
jgi:hypothetical protein